MDGERLRGGRTTGATRVGETVRKPVQPSTPAVHAVLGHLEAVGFDGAPRSWGTDDEGRQMLSYLRGRPSATGVRGPPGSSTRPPWSRSGPGSAVCTT